MCASSAIRLTVGVSFAPGGNEADKSCVHTATGAALGAGCSFAFEDSQTLSLALNHAYAKDGTWSAETVETAREYYADRRSAIALSANLVPAVNLYDSARGPHLRKIFKLLEREDMTLNGTVKTEAALEEERKEKAKGTTWLTNFDPELEFAAVIAGDRPAELGIVC